VWPKGAPVCRRARCTGCRGTTSRETARGSACARTLPWGYHAVRDTMPTRAHHLLDDVVHQKVVVRAAQPLLRHTVPCRARAARSHTRMKLRTAPIRSVMQHATLHMQCATCNMRCATCNATHAMCNMQHATRNMQHATRKMQRATCNMQRAKCNVQHATCSMQGATCNAQNATCNMQRAACKLQHATPGRSDSRAASALRYSTAAPAAAMTRQRQ
jgi:hypothetical protein